MLTAVGIVGSDAADPLAPAEHTVIDVGAVSLPTPEGGVIVVDLQGIHAVVICDVCHVLHGPGRVVVGDKEAGVSSIVEESEPTVSYIGGPVNSDPAQLVKEVPNYVGKQYPACASLEGSSFEVNPVNVHRVYSDTVAQDTVITQYPAAGTEVAVPAQVVLIVSMGSNKPKAVTPEVLIGQTYGTALATLLDAGYEWENIYVDFSDKSQNFDHIVATANINDKTVTLSLTAPAETPDPFAPDAY